MSFAQELLSKPVPIENRIAYLPLSIESRGQNPDAATIANLIGASVSWVKTTAREVGLEDVDDYSEYALDILKEELHWQELYDSLGERVSLEKISSILGKNRHWVQRWAADVGSYARYEKLEHGREVATYETGVLYQLRHIILSIPPANGWYTAREIGHLTQQKRETVLRILEDHGIEGELRRIVSDGREFVHFPPEVVSLVIPDYPLGGDWFTVRALAQELDKDRDWVVNRIADCPSQLRLGDGKRLFDHYSPQTLEMLREKLAAEKHADTYLSLRGLSRVLGKSTSWVARRLPYVKAATEERVDTGNRSFTHYHPDAVEQLRLLPPDVLKSDPSRVD